MSKSIIDNTLTDKVMGDCTESIRSMVLEVQDNIRDLVINDYVKSIKDTLLSGNSFYIDGIGYLRPKYRKVKNDAGRDFAIVISLKQDSDFSKLIVESCMNNKDNFKIS